MMPNNDYILRSDAINALTVSAMLRNLDSVEDGPAHMYKRAAERIIAGVPAADVEPKQRWIPVTERLPERFVEVLVVSNGSVIHGYLGYMGLWFTGINRALGSVTHWMPMPSTPEPPKEEDNG